MCIRDRIHLVDHFGVNRENALDALAEADLAHGETGLRSVVALDDDALKPVSYTHLDVYKRQRYDKGIVRCWTMC